MKVAIVLSFVAAAMASVVEKRGCNANNCARQVTGTRGGLLPITSRQADCSAFQTSTFTPEPTTTTVTVTVDVDEPRKLKRDAALEYRAATEVPAYASSCNDGAAYASACSCWGITSGVTTAPTPTKTETVTVTQDYCEDL